MLDFLNRGSMTEGESESSESKNIKNPFDFRNIKI